LAGIRKCSGRKRSPGCVIVLGADGIDAALLEHELRKGKLPHLASLIEGGGWSPLRTTNPAESPVAWASFATGLNPGKHGIFDFLHCDPQTYRLRVGPLSIRRRPDGSGLEAINHRCGETIWNAATAAGKACVLLRVPGTCPPEPVRGRMLAGLGVPDLLGTWGTSWLFTSAKQPGNRKQCTLLPRGASETETAILGPQDVSIPLLLRAGGDTLHLSCQGHAWDLRAGEWSPWIPLRFRLPSGGHWRGIARFYLRQLHPDLSLYLSPLNIDPRDPVLPLTYPAAFAAELVKRHGLFSTLGWAEDASGLGEGRLDEEGFLHQVYEVLDQQEAMTLSALSQGDHDLLISVFEATDRVQHMFWPRRDAGHPSSAHGEGSRNDGEISRCYRRFDELVGKVMAELQPEDTLIVMSDHGFKPVRKLVHWNAWLRDHGYLVQAGIAEGQGTLWSSVDWSRTRAYAVGLSKIYINLKGREGRGIVEPGREYRALCRRISGELLALQDPETMAPVLRQIYHKDRLYSGNKVETTGDLIVGLHEGYRTSQQTAVGRIPSPVIVSNKRKWRADHCSIDPPLVPGITCCNRPLAFRPPSILDPAPTILTCWKRRFLRKWMDVPCYSSVSCAWPSSQGRT